MIEKVKDELVGKRIVLKRITPSISLAQIIFDTIDKDREHLEPWFHWIPSTLKVEDTMDYLLDKEEQFKKKERFEYGIYLGDTFLGNIVIFSIYKDKKYAEVGYWLSSKFTKKGYMTEALNLVEKEFFSKTEITGLQIRCDDANIASIGVAKKCGYEYKFTNRESEYSPYFDNFRNTAVFSKLKSEFKKQDK